MMRKLILSGFLLLCSVVLMAQNKYDFLVAADGSGDFKTVQEAINAVPDMRANRTRIFIKPGVYKEKLTLPANKTNVSFVGEDPAKTILTFDDFAQRKNRFGENIGTSGSSSFFIYGDGFTAENITFENSAGSVGQAVAVRIDGDKVSFFNCRFLGFQDTLYPHGEKSRQYYKNCYIEGTVDYVFGFSTVLFDNCTLFCKKAGYVTAASTPKENAYGFVFRNCKITGSAPEGAFALGRPWRPYAKVVYLECEMDNVIAPAGWNNWGNAENEKTAYYAEYKSRGAGVNVSQRMAWSHHLTEEETRQYTTANILGDWNPETGR
ncbi:pectinesterase family protein [Paludibacter jiangxiensis]|uniref:Pectinesterase n=1 Tax=Paludibacter jiangxiensis TaxID=681398 RepID=A0A171AG09_9BACT|nr:pectinesterase family protein [Paludibacter jiangxiensis]GAT63669.1 pectinesterase [Paludibacter jiangxiensis]